MKKHHKAICILGMHRSGTSVVTRAINLLGAYLGEDEDLHPPLPDNREGNWERLDVVDFHNRLLKELKENWYTCLPLPEQWHTSEKVKPFRDELLDLIRKNFSRHPLWAWKDPRTCLLLPLWIDVLNEMGIELSCVYVERNPIDVARSLYKRDGFSHGKSYGLWFFYNITALQTSHTLTRYFMSYDRFLSNWESELRECANTLKIKWPEDDSFLSKKMNEFIRHDLWHNASQMDDFKKNDIPHPVIELYEIIDDVIGVNSLAKNVSFINNIEEIAKEFGAYASFFKYDISELWERRSEINLLNEQIIRLCAIVQTKEEELNNSYANRFWKLLKQNIKRISIYNMVIRKVVPIVSKGGRVFVDVRHLLYKDPYKLWMRQNEPSPSHFKFMKTELCSWFLRPKMSIILPVYNPTEYTLEQCLNSVLDQVYDNWEILIVDGGLHTDNVNNVIRKYTEKDNRIQFIPLSKNMGIAESSNTALKLATGDYVVFLGYEDMLAPFALYEVVKHLNEDPSVDFLYSDEDKVSLKGRRRFEPFFKPDWSPDAFLSYNYINKFAVIRKSIIDNISGFREGYDDAQDYDLFLRAVHKTNKIKHIPKILYHWRSTSRFAASEMMLKPYALDAAKKTILEYLKDKGLEAEVFDGLFPLSFRVKYRIRYSQKVSIIIPTRDKVHLLRQCVTSILEKTDYKAYEIIIVDNQSEEQQTHGFTHSIRDDQRVKILQYNKPFNFAAINNYAASYTDGEYLLFLNNDTEVINPEWLSAMLEFAQREDVGAVGAKLLYPNNTIQHAGVILGVGGVANHSHLNFHRSSHGYFGRINVIQNFSAVTGACIMMRRNVFEEVGGFDESLSHAFNDVDLCLKIRDKGYLIVYTPYAELYHHESASRGYDLATPERKQRFDKEIDIMRGRWKNVLDAGDPYYNPNLSLDRPDFSIKHKG